MNEPTVTLVRFTCTTPDDHPDRETTAGCGDVSAPSTDVWVINLGPIATDLDGLADPDDIPQTAVLAVCPKCDTPRAYTDLGDEVVAELLRRNARLSVVDPTVRHPARGQ